MDTLMALALVFCLLLSVTVWVMRMKKAATRLVTKRRYQPTKWDSK